MHYDGSSSYRGSFSYWFIGSCASFEAARWEAAGGDRGRGTCPHNARTAYWENCTPSKFCCFQNFCRESISTIESSFLVLSAIWAVDFRQEDISAYVGIDWGENNNERADLARMREAVSLQTLLSWTCCILQLHTEWNFAFHTQCRNDE